MRLPLILFFFIAAPIVIYAHEPAPDNYRFIENKNQWDHKIEYKVDIPSGALFLEKNTFTYHLIDGAALKSLHPTKDSTLMHTLKIKGHVFKVNFENANPDVQLSGDGAYPDYYNYYQGKDPSHWASKVNAFTQVAYQNLYEGIDLKFYTYDHHLKYDLIILPNSDPSVIQINYQGLDRIGLSEGNLILQTSLGKIVEQKPYAYQTIQGKVRPVACHYVLKGTTLSFAFPNGYDKKYKLIIDPTLIFSTYSGSTIDNFGYTATFDSDGFLYSGSTAFGLGYPTTLGAYQTTFKGGSFFYQFGIDIGITKYDTSGTKRIYSTYLGGSSDELPHSMIVNSRDELFIYGTTGSSDFPIVSGAYDSTFAGGSYVALWGIACEYDKGSDIFVARLSNDGSSLLASTYIGGTQNDGINLSGSLRYNYADEVRGEIDVDRFDNIYIVSCTNSPDFPIEGNPFQPAYGGGFIDACIIKMNDALSTIQWSSFLGAEFSDAAYSLALDDSSDIYISGGTFSQFFPTSGSVLFNSFQGGRSDGFITHISHDGQNILHSTYYGSTEYDQIYFVELDNTNNVYVLGQTQASGNTFVHNALFSQLDGGQFISKMTPELDSLIWSTTFGTGNGKPDISPTAFLVDLCNKIYLSGWGGNPENNDFLFAPPVAFNMLTTLGPNPPTDYFDPTTNGSDFYLFVLEDDASAVHYASFFGGDLSREHVDGGTSRFDKKGKIYQAMCAGCEGHSDMILKPTFGNAELPDTNRSDNCNIGVFKMDFRLPIVVADFTALSGCPGEPIQFNNKSLVKSATTFTWLFGDGTSSNASNPIHTYATGGTFYVTLIVSDNATCNLADTIIKPLYISTINSIAVAATADKYTIFKGKSTTLHAQPNSGYLYTWAPSSSLSSSTNPNPVAKPDTTTTYTLTVSDPLLSRCRRNANVTINVIEIICDEPYIFIPNAFTPNDDGDNDVLYIRSNNILEMYLTIYDRWGEKVFETRDQNVGWNGIYKGMKADPGVFVYYLEVTCLDEEKFFKKGNITLIR